jgi:hypothetical protein
VDACTCVLAFIREKTQCSLVGGGTGVIKFGGVKYPLMQAAIA